MLNILIPMAGLGSRFARAGFEKPKPFIDVAGAPMIVRVLQNLQVENSRFILIAQREHLERESVLFDEIQEQFPVTVVPIDGLTEGTACTALLGRDYINSSEPLLIANSDQLVDVEIAEFLKDAKSRHLDGSILCFHDELRDPKWSFARTDASGMVVEVKEKEAISNFATVGIYYFAEGRLFVENAQEMISAGDRTNGEFYTCPTYNFLARKQFKIGIYEIPISAMHGIGTPEDLEIYLKHVNFSSVIQ